MEDMGGWALSYIVHTSDLSYINVLICKIQWIVLLICLNYYKLSSIQSNVIKLLSLFPPTQVAWGYATDRAKNVMLSELLYAK